MTPYEVYSQFLTEETTRKNRGRNEQRLSGPQVRCARVKRWVPTDTDELRVFFGIIILMGVVRMPEIPHYWSHKKSDLYLCPLISMQRHEKGQAPDDVSKRLYKLDDLIPDLTQNFQAVITPGRELVIVIDESMISARNRLSFRQYIPSKAQKYGIKLYKLCSVSSYTLNIRCTLAIAQWSRTCSTPTL
ncbi:PiggyBac transposable element-derived protein 4 [Frankliniella fusca]|uniref:PiggyBac transposable element-derived protein 4 n=1 Tax=Frankliniella fusca TaxID=407009 RepID=A0AAE1LQS0_9NEOP|nr:PiggyBac transposable element-derived protein 4 [Frankliniella fusca]